MATLSLEQLNKRHNITPTTPTSKRAFSLEEIQKRQPTPTAPVVEEKPKRSVFGKVAHFLAPTATKAFEKVKAGEKLGFRDIAGSALEIGSFLLPVGAIGRGLGLAGKGAITAARAVKGARALSLAQKAKLGAVAGGLGGALSSAGEAIGEEGTKVSDVTARALGGATLGVGFGAALPVVGRGISKGVRKFTGRAAQRAEQAALLRKGTPDTRIARKTLTEAGEVVTDPKAVKAIRQGIPEQDISVIKSASRLDKQKMAKMLNIRKSQLTNKRITARATDVVGDTFLDQAKFIEKTNKEAGKKLGVVAQRLGGKKVDPTDAITDLANRLDNAGVKVNKKGQLNFRGSDFDGLKAPQTAIRNVWARAMRVAKTRDALQMHRTKSFIDEVVDYGKAAEGLSGRAQRILKGFRRNIDGVLDTNFPEYNRVNTVFAETIQQLDSIAQSMGRKFRLGDTFANAKAGVTMRQILSNTKGRSNILQLLESMQGVAKKHGFKVQDDIINQTLFADTLENILGSEAPTSFLGQIEKGVSRFGGVAEAGADIVRGKPISATIKAGKAAADALRGRNQENMIKALDDLLGVKPRTVFGKPSVKKIVPIVKKKIESNVKPKSKYLFHGTSSSVLDDIKKSGLKSGKSGNFLEKQPSGVFLTQNLDDADFFSMQSSKQKGGDRVLLRIKSDKAKNLVVDEKIGDSFINKKDIKPSDIEVKVGNKWIPITKKSNFGKSKVAPIVKKKTKPFESKVFRGIVSGKEDESIGRFLTTDKKLAQFFANFKQTKTGKKGRVITENIKFENPFTIKNADDAPQNIFKSLQNKIPNLKKIVRRFDEGGLNLGDKEVDDLIVEGQKIINDYAKKRGHDGVVYGTGDTIVDLRPIKESNLGKK